MCCIRCENEITEDQIGLVDMLADNEKSYPPYYTCKTCARKDVDETRV